MKNNTADNGADGWLLQSLLAEMVHETAEQGFADAQYDLGVCYVNGYGVPQDVGKAAEWFRKTAEQGHAEAQSCLSGL